VIHVSGVFAVDGHDGSGKTTLARWLAASTGGYYHRPFHGALGDALLSAGNRGEAAKVIALGEEGIRNAIAAAGTVRPIVLDRAWMTVASLVDWSEFFPVWRLWIPTALCWADLATTLDRLGRRPEKSGTTDNHDHYLKVYRSLADRTGSCVVRTDLSSESQCRDFLIRWLKGNPSLPRIQPPSVN
jgi:hypothetical protein